MSNRKGLGKQANRTEIAEFFGVAMPTVDHWVRTGCPVVQRGSKGVAWIFNTADVAAWREQKIRDDATNSVNVDAEELKRRKLLAQTEREELELAKAKGEVAPVDEFRRVQAARMALIRSNVLNVPARAALQLIGETDEATFKRVLRAELVLALERAAEEPIEIEADDDADDAD